MRKTNGFSLIEVMAAMAVLAIIAAVSVPQVQAWNARNRGLQAVTEILSDFSKARSVAGYTVVGDNGKIQIPVNIAEEDGDKMDVYIGIRLQTALVFRKSEYAIYQKESMKTGDWSSSRLLKKNLLPNNVTIEKVNQLTPSSSLDSFGTMLSFTSNGQVKNGDSIATTSKQNCGGNASHLQNVVFSAVLRSKIGTSDDSMWYRVDIDQTGEYFICSGFSSSSSYSDSIFTSDDAEQLSL